MKKHIFLILLLLVGIFTYAVDKEISLSPKRDSKAISQNEKGIKVVSYQKLNEQFPKADFKEVKVRGAVYFHPRLRLGEIKKLCSGIIATVVTDAKYHKPVLVWGDRIWVKFEDHKTRSHARGNSFLKQFNSKILPQYWGTDKFAFSVKIPDGETVQSFVDKLNKLPEIEYAEPCPIYHSYYIPDDPRYNQGLYRQWQWPLIKMEEAWDITKGDASIVYEINDTGVSLYTLPNDANIATGATYVPSEELENVSELNPGGTRDPVNNDNIPADDNGHGTFIANLIFGDMDDKEYGCGMAPNVTLLPYKAGGCDGAFGHGTDGITYGTANGAHVINCSYGGSFQSQTNHAAIDAAWDAGIVVVASSGNEADTTDPWQVGNPAEVINALAIGACDSTGMRADFSNYGWGSTIGWQGNESGELFCVAPGETVWTLSMGWSDENTTPPYYPPDLCGTADPTDQYWCGASGTSFSGPIVAGLVALMYSCGASDPGTIRDIIASTCDHTSNGYASNTATSIISGANTYSEEYGHGLIDVTAALLQVSPAPYIVISGKSYDDSLGDNDGIPEPGEDIKITLTLKNEGQNDPKATLTSVSAKLSTEDYWIDDITDNTSAFLDITGQSSRTASDPFEFIINQYCPNLREIEFSVYITGKYDSATKNYSTTRTFRMTVGISSIIIVDVDSGAAINGYTMNSDESIGNALSQLGWQYENLITVPTDLNTSICDIVFVASGNVGYYWPPRSKTGDYQVFTGSELSALNDFVDNDGNLYFEGSGQSERYSGSVLWPQFGTSYGTEGDTYEQSVNISDVSGGGVSGSGLGNKVVYENNVSNPGWGTYTNSYNTIMNPDGGASATVTSNGDQGKNAVRVVEWNIPAKGKTIWSDILLGGIESSDNFSIERSGYMDTIMDFFGKSTNPSDNTPPSKAVLSIKLNGFTRGKASISWVAPGDDGDAGWIYDAGSNEPYIMKYVQNNTDPYNDNTPFGSMTNLPGEPTITNQPGRNESMTVTGLTAGNTYVFQLRVTDESSNYSDSDKVVKYFKTACADYTGQVWLLVNDSDIFDGEDLDFQCWKDTFTRKKILYDAVYDLPTDLSDYDVVFLIGNLNGCLDVFFDDAESARLRDYIDAGGNVVLTGMRVFTRIDIQGMGTAGHWVADYWGLNMDGDHTNNYNVVKGDNGLAWQSAGFGSKNYPSPANYNPASWLDGNGDFLNETIPENAGCTAQYFNDSWKKGNGWEVTTFQPSGGIRMIESIALDVFTTEADQDDWIQENLDFFGYSTTDNCSPDTVTDLIANLTVAAGEVRLTWTSPGNDNWVIPLFAPDVYVMKQDTSIMDTVAKFDAASNVTGTLPTPENAGIEQTMVATGLATDQGYYFRLSADDTANNGPTYSNNAYIYLPGNLASPKILVFDAANPWMGDPGSLYDGINDAGQPADRLSTPLARALTDLGYSYDYVIDETEGRGPAVNNTNVLPADISGYDVMFIEMASASNTNMFSTGDQAKINSYLTTDNKNLFWEDWFIYQYQFDDNDQKAPFWDLFAADVTDIAGTVEWYETGGYYYNSMEGVVSAMKGDSNPFNIANGMKFKFDNASDPDYLHDILTSSGVDSYRILTVTETKCDSPPQLYPPGFTTTMAHWNQGNNVRTVLSGSALAGLTPYDDYWSNSTYTNLIKNIMIFFGYGGNVGLEVIKNTILNPVWNPNGVDGYYIYSYYGSNPALYKINNLAYSEKDNIYQYTNVDLGLHHGSNITTDGTNVYYGRYDEGPNHMEIYKVPEDDSAAAVANYPVGAGTGVPWAKKWYDPDYINGAVFADGKPRIAASHVGEIVTYLVNSAEANDPNTLDIVRLTGFQGSVENNDTIEPKCYQPKWAPDGDSVVFVYRPATPGGTAAKSGIYIITDVLHTIAISNATQQYWATSLSDSRIKEIYKYGRHPTWSPSFSQDGSIVAFTVDVTDKFDNHDFITNAKSGIENTNFDIYKKTVAKVGYPEDMILSASDKGEAFTKWATEGGDKLCQVTYKYIDSNTFVFRLNSFSDDSNTYGGWTNKAGESGLKVTDHAKTSLEIKGDITEYGFKTIKILPVQKKFEIPNGYKYFGASRTIVTEPRGTVIPNGANLKLHFTKGAMYNVDPDKERLGLYYVNNDKLEKVNANIALCENGYEGYAYANITKQGDYVICALPKASAYADFTKVRVFPNPVRVGKVQGGTIVEGVVLDRLPDKITEINIYNIAGEKVATLDDDAVTCYEPALNTHYPNIDGSGVSVYWDLNNCDGEKVASGIYIVILKAEGIDPIYKKIAVIK